MITSKPRVLGIVLVFAGSVLWSSAGFFMRMVHLDTWTVLVWRSVFGAVTLGTIAMARHGRRSGEVVRGLGWPGLLAIPVSAVSIVAYIGALAFTTVANVMVVYATLPFIAAALAFLWAGERTKPRVLYGSLFALFGVGIMAAAGTHAEDLVGNGLALVMTATFAILLVMARRDPSLDMAPVNGFAALLCAIVCLPLASHDVPGPMQMMWLALFGILTSGVAYLLFLTGGRYIPASEAGLIGFVDVLLGPLWVWLAFNERPGGTVFVGGAFVCVAVVWYLVGELRDAAPERA